MESIRRQALAIVSSPSADAKLSLLIQMELDGVVDADEHLDPISILPGREERPLLVAPGDVVHRSVHTLAGCSALIHALAHIELNAVNLASDIVWRFPGMPDRFYREWMLVAREEAVHFALLRDHLQTMGSAYGDFAAHNALWEMAEKTKADLLARLALVPRTLEARGLDASPAIKAKLVQAGDLRGGEILDIILRDEIGHVAVGNHWYRWICDSRGLNPITTYALLAEQFKAPRLKGPFNLVARRAAGFSDEELAQLQA